nr:MAG TPA: hypothetical protein [Bacteriophage sp.]
MLWANNSNWSFIIYIINFAIIIFPTMNFSSFSYKIFFS